MSGPHAVALIATLATLFVYFAVGVHRRREIKTLDDFLLYGRSLSEGGYEATFVATSISLATVLFFFLDFTGPLGIALVLSPVMYTLGCWIFLLALPRLESSGYLKDGSTIHNFIAVAFQSSALRYSTAAVSVIGYLGILIIEIHVGTTIFSIFSPRFEWTIIVAVFLLTLIFVYTYFGGYRAVVDTDRIQVLLIFFGTLAAILSLIYLNWREPAVNPIASYEKLAPFPWLLPSYFIVVMIVGNVPFQILRMDNWLRAAAVRELQIVHVAMKRSIGAAFVSWVIFAVMGLLLYRIADVGPGTGVITFLRLLTDSDSAVLRLFAFPLLFTGCVAAMVSTADSVFLPVVASWIYDFKYPAEVHDARTGQAKTLPPEMQHKLLLSARRSILGFLGLGIAIYIFLIKVLSFQFVDLLFVFFNQQLVLFPTVTLALLAARHPLQDGPASSARLGGLIGLWLGWLGTWAATIYGTLNDSIQWVLYASAIGFATSIVITFLINPRAVWRIVRYGK